MEVLEKIRDLLDKACVVLGGAAVLALMVLATGNVCFRVFGMPYRGAYELVAFLGAVVTAFALGYTQRKKSHIVVDILTETF
ncbi:MAG: TRAP transporter small permease subunit, partial [Deltaproteobacteria bacterium]|nr:TRAP transporter small permease subunit [Deltaproteobacteria bacterium]